MFTENYRTETEYENHLNIKLFSFEFFNCFCLLFYTAFWKQDIEYLRSLLIGILITRQILGNVLESLLPYASSIFLLIGRWYTVKTKLVLEKKRLKRQQADSQAVSMNSIESEQLLAPYEQTYDDYLEMSKSVMFKADLCFSCSVWIHDPVCCCLSSCTLVGLFEQRCGNTIRYVNK